GAIEGFVTGSGLPTAVRGGIGGAVEGAFLTYLFVLGRAAAARGATGMLGEARRGWDDEDGWERVAGPSGGPAAAQSPPVALTDR
ncbi:MAG TPA: hypothetical protein PKA98_09710, partial [Acidimicrobiales bacterium]|nr:hypothetical protein [Acidimicrobiales bacterium]